MTLDAEVRALERDARARPDDGAAQVGLAAALTRMGRDSEALEAFIRAASAQPGDPEVVRALAATSWWSSPRGTGGGTRFVPVPGLRRKPTLVAARRLGQGGVGLALGRGLIFARVTEEGSLARLVTLALATARELWSREEIVAAPAPPLACGETVLDAALVEEGASIEFRVRARDAVSGADRWVRRSELPDVQPGATFVAACAAGERVAFAISPHGQKEFEPFVRVLDASSGAPLDGFALRGVTDLALEGDVLYASAIKEPRRVLARRVDGTRVFDALRGQSVQRVVALPGHLVVATDEAIARLSPTDGEFAFMRSRRFGQAEALVVTPRAIVGSWQRDATVALSLETGERLWGDEPNARMLSAAADTLYAVSNDGHRIRALDLATGEPLWQTNLRDLAAELGGSGVHKLAVAPSRLVGLTKEGVLFLLA